MKVFQLVTSIDLGGAENVVFNLCDYFHDYHPEIKMIVFEIHSSKNIYATEKKKILKENGIEFRTLGNRYKYFSLTIAPFVLLYQLLKEQPAIVHSHTDLPDFVLSITLKFILKPGFRLFRTIHNTALWSTHNLLGKIAESSFQNDTIISVSDSAQKAYEEIRKRYKVNPSPDQHIIYNGVKSPSKKNESFQTDPTKINIVFAGRFELQKGIDLFLDLLDHMPNELHSKCMFHIIGAGTYQKQVEKAVQKHNNCRYYGLVTDLSNKLTPFQVLFMPSRFEGLGLLSIEASMSGLLVIASNVAGLRETLPEDWPYLVTNYNTDSFQEKLMDLIKPECNWEKHTKYAYNYVIEKFSWKQMGEKHYNLYHQSNVPT